MSIFARVSALLNHQKKRYDADFFRALIISCSILIFDATAICLFLVTVNILLVSAASLPAPLLVFLPISYFVIGLALEVYTDVTPDQATTNFWMRHVMLINYCMSLFWLSVLPSSILSYVVYGSLMLVCATSLALTHRLKCDKETAQMELAMTAGIFTFLFLAHLPITPMLLSTAVIPAPLLVATIALCAWLSILIFAPPQPVFGKQATSRIPAFYLGILMLTGILTFCGLPSLGIFGNWALASLSPLAQSTTLFFFLIFANGAAAHIGRIWDKLWLMDSMIKKNHQVQNLHFNYLYCLIAHLGALVFSVANLHNAFTNPVQYIQRIGAHCQFLAIRTWHFFYLHLINPIESCLYTDKTVTAFAAYRTRWEFMNEADAAPTIRVTTTNKEAFEAIQQWEQAEINSVGGNKLGEAKSGGEYACSFKLFNEMSTSSTPK
jgi:hypothetical protein